MLGKQGLGQESEDIWWGFPSFCERPPGSKNHGPPSRHTNCCWGTHPARSGTGGTAVIFRSAPQELSTGVAAQWDPEKCAVWGRGGESATPRGDKGGLICAARQPYVNVAGLPS